MIQQTQSKPPLTTDELAFMRAIAEHFIKSGDHQKLHVGTTMLMLLDHIDYVTLEGKKVKV